MASCITSAAFASEALAYPQMSALEAITPIADVYERALLSLQNYGVAKEREKYALKLMASYRRRRQSSYTSFLSDYDLLLKHPDISDVRKQSLRQKLETINAEFHAP